MLADVLASPVFQTVALAVAGAVGTLLAAAVVRGWAIIRTRLLRQLDAQQMAIVDSLAARAVRYAFQVVESQDRLAEASRIVAEQAAARGIPLTAEQIRLYIEAAYVDFKLTVATTPIVSEPAGPAVEIGGRA